MNTIQALASKLLGHHVSDQFTDPILGNSISIKTIELSNYYIIATYILPFGWVKSKKCTVFSILEQVCCMENSSYNG